MFLGCDVNIIAGDFNVDFGGGQFAKLLNDFMTGLDLHACDLNFRSSAMSATIVSLSPG